MKKLFLFIALTFSLAFSIAQSPSVPRPKLVVGIVVDQMRWDYLYRYYDRFSPNGGFKRFLNEGFSCEKNLINYTPTLTAIGHSSIFTGSVPSIHGITGNNWWDRYLDRSVYCTEDNDVSTVGSSSKKNGMQSPKNLLVTTITDELRLATNFRSKVFGIALKDRGGILPAGHSANAAYWYDGNTGNWITSTYYMQKLPDWAQKFNDRKLVDQYYKLGWDLLESKDKYGQSKLSNDAYKRGGFGEGFPYRLDTFATKNYSNILTTPYGNTLTAEFAKEAIINEKLGKGQFTDFLTLSFSSTDYVGHTFGPNSAEAEDTYIRLDKDLGEFFNFLDKHVGKGQYTVFLSADHGATQAPEFLNENKIPAGRVFAKEIMKNLNDTIQKVYGLSNIIKTAYNYQVLLDNNRLDSAKINRKEFKQWLINLLLKQEGIVRAFDIDDLNIVPLPSRMREMMNNGYNYSRGGDIQLVFQSHHIDAYSKSGTTHGLWNPYDAHIPLLWYGWGINKGILNRTTNITDIAPTVAALLKIQEPSGNIGSVITEVLK